VSVMRRPQDATQLQPQAWDVDCVASCRTLATGKMPVLPETSIIRTWQGSRRIPRNVVDKKRASSASVVRTSDGAKRLLASLRDQHFPRQSMPT
jgi:hypothetical protein